MANPDGWSVDGMMSAVVAGVAAGIGTAMAWFNGEKKALRTKMHTLQNEMVSWNMAQSETRRKHDLLEQRHENIEADLGDIKKYCEKLDVKMDALRDLVKTKT